MTKEVTPLGKVYEAVTKQVQEGHDSAEQKVKLEKVLSNFARVERARRKKAAAKRAKEQELKAAKRAAANVREAVK